MANKHYKSVEREEYSQPEPTSSRAHLPVACTTSVSRHRDNMASNISNTFRRGPAFGNIRLDEVPQTPTAWTAKMRKLPPLNAIKAFEAAARLVSFTKAGAELGVTHGAISRQVALLENWLGVPLFRRLKSQIELTVAGKSFLDAMGPALDRIALAVVHLTEHSDPVTVGVNAPPTFTLRWLIPRLSIFQRRHLGIDVRLTTSLAPIDFAKAEYNIAIRGAEQPLAGAGSRAFLTESILPVCHPDLLHKLPLAVPADLKRHTLLSYATEPYPWAEWLRVVNAPDLKPEATLNFEQMYFTLQAALEGLGVALIPYFMVADDIAAERLCTPFGALGVRTRHYYANWAPDATPNMAQKAFCDWLESEGRETMALCDQLTRATTQKQGR
jgi:LysR family glycine cleavage system transcriptional activator